MQRKKLKLALIPLALASVAATVTAGLVTGAGAAAGAVAPTDKRPTISGTA